MGPPFLPSKNGLLFRQSLSHLLVMINVLRVKWAKEWKTLCIVLCMRACLCLCVCAWEHLCAYVCKHKCVCLHGCMCVGGMCACVCICVCSHAYKYIWHFFSLSFLFSVFSGGIRHKLNRSGARWLPGCTNLGRGYQLSIDLAVGKALLIGTKTSLSFILAVIFGTSPSQRLVLLYAIFHPCL